MDRYSPEQASGDGQGRMVNLVMNRKEGPVRQRPIYLALCAFLCVSISEGAPGATTTTTFTYDAGDHVASVKDPRNLATSYAYDGLGQLWQQVSPDTGTTTYGYDTYGRRSSMTRADGVVTTYGYDGLNRVTSVTAGGQTQNFSYDNCTNGVGRLCSASDSTGNTSYSYTPEGWLAGRGFSIEGTSYALGYGYDAMGRLSVVDYPDGNQAIYSYTDGAVSNVTLKIGGTSQTGVSDITYRPGNLAMSTWISSNGLSNTLNYDTDGRLTGISVSNVQSMALAYDKADRIASTTNGIDPDQSQNYNYDGQSRLTAAYGVSNNERYSYDAGGNRTSQTVNGAVSTFSIDGASNRLMGITGAGAATYGYNAQGNLQTIDGATIFRYNSFNRLSVANGSANYVNPEGQRLRKVSSTGTKYFAPEGGSLMAESTNGGWIDYIWLNERLVGRISDAAVFAIHSDQTGRPEVVTDTAAVAVWKAANHPFGRTVVRDELSAQNLGFPGQYYDVETNNWNNGFRDYNAFLGRYLEADLVGLLGGTNLYTYVNNNSLSRTDPLGLWQVTISAELGLGGLLTFGYNSGQFNIGGYIGIGEGAAVSVNPGDSGCHEVGAWRGTRGDARLGAGVLGADVSATVGPGVNEGEVALQTPIKNLIVGASVSNGKFSDRPITANVVVGESAFLGYGGQMYFGK